MLRGVVKTTSHSAIFGACNYAIETPTMFHLQKAAHVARLNNYSFEFCTLHTSHTWKSLSGKWHYHVTTARVQMWSVGGEMGVFTGSGSISLVCRYVWNMLSNKILYKCDDSSSTVHASLLASRLRSNSHLSVRLTVMLLFVNEVLSHFVKYLDYSQNVSADRAEALPHRLKVMLRLIHM